MFERIVVGMDGSRAADGALDLAIRVGAAFSSHLWLVAVVEDAPPYVSARREEERERVDARQYYLDLLRIAAARLRRRGLEVDTEVKFGNEVRGLLDTVVGVDADLFVIGHAGHSGVWGSRLGSTAARLVHLAPTSVLIVRPADGHPATSRVLVGYDGSSASVRAFEAAASIAAGTGARLVIAASRAIRESVDPRYSVGALASRAGRQDGTEIVTVDGEPGRRLIELARSVDGTLLVVGSTGQSHPWSPAVGPTAAHVAEHATGAVLVVRAPSTEMSAGRVMRRHVVTVDPETPLGEAARLLFVVGVKCLPVVDRDRRPVGIITLGDLLRRARVALRPSLVGSMTADEFDEALRRLVVGDLSCAAVMTRDVEVVTPEAPLSDLLARMTERAIKRLPVVDRDGGLVGIVSRADVLRALAGSIESSEVSVRRQLTGRVVGEVMQADVASVHETDELEAAARVVLASPVGRVAVLDEADRVVGVIAVRDLLPLATAETRSELIEALLAPAGRIESFLAARRARSERTLARDLMRRDVITARRETPLGDVLQRMMSKALKGVLVVDDDQHLLGVVDRADVVRAMASSLGTSER